MIQKLAGKFAKFFIIKIDTIRYKFTNHMHYRIVTSQGCENLTECVEKMSRG